MAGARPCRPGRRRCGPASECPWARRAGSWTTRRRTGPGFDHIHILILDEADRLLDTGFLPDLEHILARLPAGGADAAALRDHAPCATSVEQ